MADPEVMEAVVDESLLNDEELTARLTDTNVVVEQEEVKEEEVVKEEEPEVKKEEPAVVVDPVRVEIEKLRKKVEAQEKFIARQGTEVGLLRKRTPEQEQEDLARIREIYEQDPVQGRLAHDAYLKRADDEKQAEQQRQYLELVESTKESVTTAIPDVETRFADMAALLKEDAVDDATIDQFKKMPYAFSGNLIWNLHKRALLGKENASLKTELETLKAKMTELEGKPARVVKGIEQALKHPQVMGAKSGGAVDKPVFAKPVEALEDWTDDELNAAIAADKQNTG